MILKLVETRDYNGAGEWSAEAIVERYARYLRELGVENFITLRPQTR